MGDLETSRSTEQPKENLFEKALADSILERAKADSGSDLLAESDDGLNTLKTKFKAFHELGQHVLEAGTQLPEILDKNLYALLGSVDQVKHKEVSNRETIVVENRDGQDVNWYQSKVEAAGKFLELAQYVDVKSFGFSEEQYEKVKGLVEAIASMTEYTDAKWDELVTGKLGEGYTKDQIYGEKGALNVLLAFQRAIVAVPAEMLVEEKFKATEENPKPLFVGGIQLKIGKKGGERPKDRCTMLIEWAKNVEKEQEEAAKKEAEKKAADEARKKAEEEAKRKEAEKKAADEVARKKAEQDEAAKKAADEAAKKAAGEAAKKSAEEAKKKAEEAKKKADEAAKKATEEAKKKAEEEAKKRAEEAKKAAEEEAAKKKAESAEAKESAQLKKMFQDLKAAGIEMVTMPNKLGGTGYAKASVKEGGTARLDITLNSNGTFGYKLLSSQDSRPKIEGLAMDAPSIKLAINSEPVVKEKVMILDLQHVYIVRNRGTFNELIWVKSVTPISGEEGMYNLTVQTRDYELSKEQGRKVCEPFDVEIILEIQGGLYRGDLKEEGMVAGANQDASTFVVNAVKIASAVGLRDGTIKIK